MSAHIVHSAWRTIGVQGARATGPTMLAADEQKPALASLLANAAPLAMLTHRPSIGPEASARGSSGLGLAPRLGALLREPL